MPEIRAVISGLDAERAYEMRAGGRYEVVFDHLSGGADGITASFRLVEPNPTQQIDQLRADVTRAAELERENRALYPDEVAANLSEGLTITYRRGGGGPEYRDKNGRLLTEAEIELIKADERRRYPMRTATFGGLEGKGPLVEMPVVSTQYPAAELFMSRASNLLAALIQLCSISPLVLGIPGGGEPLSVRIYNHLTGGESYMGKHGDGKPADSKPGGSKSGGSHEKGGSGKGGK